MIPFVGVDGEGGDLTDEQNFTHHHYTMLRAGDRWIRGYPDKPAHEWLDFLHQIPRRVIPVAYFFDYDVTMMLRGLTPQLLGPLVHDQEIYYGDYRLKYRPRKELVIKRFGRQVTVNDVGTFFQCRFTRALEQWSIGNTVQREIIDGGKNARAHFGELADETIEYNAMECRLLEELMDKFRRTCEIIGYLPTRWQGPGQLAKAMFKKHGIPMTKEIPDPPPGVWGMAQAAYYGGRFETSAVGPIKGPVEGWDINSAYPYAATLLPCLLHGEWKPCKDVNRRWGVFRVSFTHTKPQSWYALPVRMADGSIRFPRHGSGWYWGDELTASQRLGAKLTVHNGYEWIQQCNHVPFHFMHRLYSVRKGIGKSEAGIALKLAMNSSYGVSAQSIGQAPYANPVYAGLFTSITRATILDAVAIDPSKVYMIATDGLFAAPGLDLPESDTLGGWEKTVYPQGMHIVQPGVYFAGNKPPKTRGVPRTAIEREETALRAAWKGSRDDGHSIELRQFIGLRLGIARGAFHTIGEWLPVSKRIGYDWSTKRKPQILRATVEGYRTEPYDNDPSLWTLPYDRVIGGNLLRDSDRLEFKDQPDWAEALTEVL